MEKSTITHLFNLFDKPTYSVDKVLKSLNSLIAVVFLGIGFTMNAQFEFESIPIAPDPGIGRVWELQEAPSDDFNYTFDASTTRVDFGPPGENKWYNTYHDLPNGQPNVFEGPGPTIWRPENLYVDGDHLHVFNTRIDGEEKDQLDNQYPYATRGGCMTGLTKVIYPVFVEARVTVANSTAASDVWLLSPDDTQEIDIIEAYGGAGIDGTVPGEMTTETGAGRNSFFAERIHLSHHVFIRPPNFQDYQPRDFNSFWRRNGITTWGGTTVDIGVYWVTPTRVEYYIDGELVRVLDDNGSASEIIGGSWEYTYPTGLVTAGGATVNMNLGNDGQLLFETLRPGFQDMTLQNCGQTAIYDESCLRAAKAASNISVLDPFDYLNNGRRFTKELDIIINTEDQTFQANSTPSRSPNDNEISDVETVDQTMLVDWIRVYKPVDDGTGDSNRARSVTFDNRASFIPAGGTDPVVDYGEVMSIDITYQTGLAAGVEEDLDYIAIQVREVDESNNIVATSAFTPVVFTTAENSGTVTVDYTIPTNFAVGSDNVTALTEAIPRTEDLDAGHKLLLLIFMQTDNGEVMNSKSFADANDTLIIEEDTTLSSPVFDAQADVIRVYPNPTQNVLNISGDFESWKVYDLSGVVVSQGGAKAVSVSSLATGLYYISLDGNKNNTYKFVKK
ncbi:T9SS type A sorting domain-containing protein [Aquimarina agarilytica]|uniref:T9SS type A sorting domain-containing protein n=1 Tax=Aquimarina agarilytica TaxID=1087449 RepID=UPI0002897CBD|nr:T9SS type A sorting domain-containing protein [Aquimarina agarilytica]